MKCIYELMLENYARCTYLFQSPRSGEFVSDVEAVEGDWAFAQLFQSPRSGKFVSNFYIETNNLKSYYDEFQSPRSGKFVSN